jgi:hypothetical protein
VSCFTSDAKGAIRWPSHRGAVLGSLEASGEVVGPRVYGQVTYWIVPLLSSSWWARGPVLVATAPLSPSNHYGSEWAPETSDINRAGSEYQPRRMAAGSPGVGMSTVWTLVLLDFQGPLNPVC